MTRPQIEPPTIGAEVTRLLADAEPRSRSDSVCAPIGRRLADRYLVIRLVGIGGMRVYQAWDDGQPSVGPKWDREVS